MKEGDGERWTTEKLDAPRYYVYWRQQPLVAVVRRCGWRPLSVSQAAGPWSNWLYLICRAGPAEPGEVDRPGRAGGS